MKRLGRCISFGWMIGLFAAHLACAQGTLVISNTNQPIDGYVSEGYGARAVFVPGSDPGGYELSGISLELGTNSTTSGPMRIELYESNDPGNLDQGVGSFSADVPTAAGLYYFGWPTTNLCYIPPQYSYNATTYYEIVILPAPDEFLNVGYTSGTNYLNFDNWTFDPEASVIDGEANYTIVNIYAIIVPPPVLQPIHLINAAVLPDDSFQFGFSNSTAFSYSVYAATNLAEPFTNWWYLGPPDNVASNYFQYNTGAGAVTYPGYSLFYFRVTSP